jgi:hypothetical protein
MNEPDWNLAQRLVLGTLWRMHNMFSRMVVAVGFSLGWAALSFAQTGSTLMLKPWAPEKLAEANVSGIFEGSGHTDNNSSDFQLSMYESSGRVRLFPGQVASPRFGYDFLALNIDSDDPGLPDQLYDQSASAGVFVWQHSGWVAGVTVGVGYAGNTPFGDGNGWYYLASVGLGKEIDKAHESVLAFVLDYDGNRTLYRDIPLPGLIYTYRLDPTIRLTLGAPVTGVLWTPIDKLTIEANYTLTDRFDASITYDITKRFAVFSRFDTRQEAFWMESLGSRDRLFFQQRRIEAGVKVSPLEQFTIVAAGGYAFGQEFSAGWDTYNSERVADVSDEFYFRVGVELQF